MRTGYYDERRAQELNQKVADIVTNGTGYVSVFDAVTRMHVSRLSPLLLTLLYFIQIISRMLTPVLLRGNAVYSPVLPTASSSQANLPTRQLPPQSLEAISQQQRESRHSSQSSRHSSYKQHHPSLLPHVEAVPPPSEDVGALDPNQSLTAGVGNTSQTNFLGYGTTALGASATGRRFQIHRGRPPSRTKPTENGVGTAVQATQTNGVPLGSETGDEVCMNDAISLNADVLTN